ncbi:MFS Git1p-like glycerophosphoinositol permease [Gymnopus androsaceus JB14]|uniref:MFS Git1p-like glycerophosphoinositol permease n=1 Tax=Gymnopus androsaceus JB14 TaxID=1447944 RepID=A0A6A4IMD2_9AGAR|nr:MFS Git1p-like glycerophosphoinositol permease [Gymnopus androsaceus JB14]
MADSTLGYSQATPDSPPTVTAEEHAAKLKREARPMSNKEKLSAYFTIAAAALGLISDGYQNNLMTMANVVFKDLYPADYTSVVSTRVSNALLVGAVLGQFFVGLVCDRVGRKVALFATTAFIVLGAILATAAHASTPPASFGITGVGVGGEYPAGSTSASEAANEKMPKNRGPVFVMVTNFVLQSVLIFLIVLSAAGDNHLQTVWRVCFGIGILLPLGVFVVRMRMMSTILYRKGAIKHHVPYGLVFKRYWRSLIGTCCAWFLYDFVTFPNGVFSGTIISSVIKDSSIKKTGEWQLLLGTIALPGIFVGAWLCNIIGRRNTLMLGFSGYLVFGLIIGLAYDKITKIVPLFVVFYGLMQSSGNLGPGDMMGLVSVESYPTAIRGTCYGISAALGKVGAAVGTQAFTPIETNLGKKWTFIIAAICGVAGILVTYFFIPDMTGVDLADEDAKFMEYLAANGWEGRVGEDADEQLIVSVEKGSLDEKN